MSTELSMNMNIEYEHDCIDPMGEDHSRPLSTWKTCLLRCA